MNKKIENFLNELSYGEKDELYRHLWFDRVKTDVIQYCKDNDIAYNDESFVDSVAVRYVCGKYDCNLSYWDNISNLVADVTEELQSKRFELWETEYSEKTYRGEFDIDTLRSLLTQLPISSQNVDDFCQTIIFDADKTHTLHVDDNNRIIEVTAVKPFCSIDRFMALIYDIYNYNAWSDEMMRDIIDEAACYDDTKKAFEFLNRMLPAEIPRDFIKRLPFLN